MATQVKVATADLIEIQIKTIDRVIIADNYSTTIFWRKKRLAEQSGI